jgi:alpha-L-fucosidase 2
MESMFYSRPGFIEPLPALPKDAFRRGSIKGMLARTYATVDELAWDLEEGVITLTITSKVDQQVTACCRMAFSGFQCEGAAYGPGSADMVREVRLNAGQRAVLRWTGAH